MMKQSDAQKKQRRSRGHGMTKVVMWSAGLTLGCVGVAIAVDPLPMTENDFYMPGTQPGALSPSNPNAAALVASKELCLFCHSSSTGEGAADLTSPVEAWNTSMMAQASRDPVFHAAFAIANQDVENIGALCFRCHYPMAVYSGRGAPDGSQLNTTGDMEGVSCSICHRMVDPETPAVDAAPVDQFNPTDGELVGNVMLPDGVGLEPHNANMVLDTFDRRRGPFDLDTDWGGFFPFHSWKESPFHRTARMCGQCHDVSNVAYTRQGDGTYALNDFDTPGPVSKFDAIPEQRTFSEWAMSSFANGPIDPAGDGRFGGTMTEVSTCQDCHMPQATGQVCQIDPPVRSDIKQHTFNGSNTWVIRAVDALNSRDDVMDEFGNVLAYGTGLTDIGIEGAVSRTIDTLQSASDLELYVDGSTLTTRVVNYTGHKLPTGYPEGRRMWVNVKFFDRGGNVIEEKGHYDMATAELTHDTKVYEAEWGIDETIAAATGLDAGPTFHLVLNNTLIKDNRIPPMGFTNANFEAIRAAPVGYTYADGQHWDDTEFTMPAGAYKAEASVYYQVTSKEYADFLRDTNTTNTAGTTMHTQWELWGKSEPVQMDIAVSAPFVSCPCDWNASGTLNDDDFFAFLGAFFGGTGADFNESGTTNDDDFFAFLGCFFGSTMGCN